MRTVTEAHAVTEKVCKFKFGSERLNSQQNCYLLWLPTWGRREWHEVNDKGAVGHVPSYRLSGTPAYVCADVLCPQRQEGRGNREAFFFLTLL